jgi:hypothetical protein
MYVPNFYIENEKENFEDGQVQTQKLAQKQTEAEALELTYSHLGRLVQSAEMLAYKLNLIKRGQPLKYQIYDSFDIAEKKNVDTLKYDVINFLDFYEKAILIHNKKFSYVHPASINELLNDLNIWKNRAATNDKRFFSTIIDLIKKGTYDYNAFPDQNQLYQKAMQDNAKFKKNAGFWKTFSIPILKFLDNLIKDVQEKLRFNPNYKPDIHFGPKSTNNGYLKDSIEFKKTEMEINSKLNEINNILFSISQKKASSKNLLDAVEKLNNLIIAFKKKYGDEIEFDQNTIGLLKNLINTINLDKKVAKKLNDICINVDPESMR